MEVAVVVVEAEGVVIFVAVVVECFARGGIGKGTSSAGGPATSPLINSCRNCCLGCSGVGRSTQ